MDGQALDSRYKPCDPQAENSACCMPNGTSGDNQQNDLCMDSGLCQSTSGWFAGFLYINGCTDRTGKSDDCPRLCDFIGTQYSYSVLQCEPGKFCCRAASDTENCCNNNRTIISTSHIGNLLLPSTASIVNTTFNSTTEASEVANASFTDNSTCASTAPNANLIDRSECPADNSATVGGAVGGVLGAALVGAIVALVFALRSRKHAKSKLAATQATLTSTEKQAAEEKANFQKQLKEQQKHIQTMPPNTPNGYYPPTGGYSPSLTPGSGLINEMGNGPTHGISELSGGANNSMAELMSEHGRAW